MITAAPMPMIEDIQDIRAPIAIPYPWLWLAYGAGALALVALAYAAYRLLHRRRAPRPQLPHEIALRRLADARALLVADQAREFSLLVSEVIRDYIEARFALSAAHRTTEEFLHELLRQQGSPLLAYRDVLADFMRYCDLAKFARYSLALPDMEAMLERAGTFVLDTVPSESAPADKPEANKPNRRSGSARRVPVRLEPRLSPGREAR